jgi:predicted  nucleic acid-binding Zn-ribbon protein
MDKSVEALSNRMESEIIRMQSQFLKELEKVDGRVQTARKEIVEATQMMTTELNSMKSGIVAIRNRAETDVKEANKTTKMALGEITYLKNCLDEVLVNVNSTVDTMIERFTPLMDFAENMNKK